MPPVREELFVLSRPRKIIFLSTMTLTSIALATTLSFPRTAGAVYGLILPANQARRSQHAVQFPTINSQGTNYVRAEAIIDRL